MRKLLSVACAAIAVLAIAAPAVFACTRILSNDPGAPVLVGRTMDRPTSNDPVLTVLPRRLRHDGGRMGPQQIVSDNPLIRTSVYGSLVTTVDGLRAADGLNEQGLSAHMLYFNATNFGPRDASLPGLHAGLWAQYLFDNAATATEAVALLDKIQVVMTESHGHKATVHLATEDASGASAIIEYINGKQVVHHGREYRIMTNDPFYDEEPALVKAYDFTNPTSDTALPGNVNPRDRFARATYFRRILPKPEKPRAGVAGMFAIAGNVSVPFGASYKGFGVYNIEYRTVTDDTNRLYFFELTTAPNVIWTDLKIFDLQVVAPVLTLQPDNIELNGNVSARFEKAAAPY